jgi:hypothetical protein
MHGMRHIRPDGLGRELQDNPSMSTGEFVVDRHGHLALAYRYQYCEDFPDAGC